jgi:hypothetical protein
MMASYPDIPGADRIVSRRCEALITERSLQTSKQYNVMDICQEFSGHE